MEDSQGTTVKKESKIVVSRDPPSEGRSDVALITLTVVPTEAGFR